MFGCRKCEFHKTDLENWQPAPAERYGAVFCAVLLDHLVRPWEIIDKIASCRPRLLSLDTHYASVEKALAGRWAGHWEGDGTDPLSGLSARSFWLSFKDLVLYLIGKGFLLRFAEDIEDYGNGPRAFWVCERTDTVGSSWSAVHQIKDRKEDPAASADQKRNGLRATLRMLEKAVREQTKKIVG